MKVTIVKRKDGAFLIIAQRQGQPNPTTRVTFGTGVPATKAATRELLTVLYGVELTVPSG